MNNPKINDDEIIWEYKKQFLKIFNEYTKNNLNFELTKSLFDQNCFIVSAASHYGLENWTKRLANILKKSPTKEINLETIEEWEFEDEYKVIKFCVFDDCPEEFMEDACFMLSIR